MARRNRGGEPTPPKRTERSWVVQLVYDDYGQVLNRGEIVQSLQDLEAIGYRAGGVINAVALRDKREGATGNEEYFTWAWLFEWSQFAPTVQRPTGADILPRDEPPMQPPVEDVVGDAELTGAEQGVAQDELERRLAEAETPSAA